MLSSKRQVLMERSSILPENICPDTGIPLRPPQLLRSRQIGLSVYTTDEFIKWIKGTIRAYRSHHKSADGKTITVVCELVDSNLDDSFRLVDSRTERSVDTLFKDSIHCAYHKVWRVTCIPLLQTQSDVEAMIHTPNICQSSTTMMRCEPANLKVYFIDLVE